MKRDCDLGADAVAEGDEVGCGGVAAVDEGEGVAEEMPAWPRAKPLVKAGALEQPGGGELDPGASLPCGAGQWGISPGRGRGCGRGLSKCWRGRWGS